MKKNYADRWRKINKKNLIMMKKNMVLIEISCSVNIMDLQFLNELKKEDKELRREQNKRYREKYREILNLKKQRAYHKENFEKKCIEN